MSESPQASHNPTERQDAWADLGGRPSNLSRRSEEAMHDANLGSRQLHESVEARRQELSDAAQAQINRRGAAAFRAAARQQDMQRGIDVNSVEYLAKERLEAERRQRRW